MQIAPWRASEWGCAGGRGFNHAVSSQMIILPEDVLIEVMLMEGFPLDSMTETFEVSETSKVCNRITRVSSDLVAHRLFVCLDAQVHDETIAVLAMGDDDVFICLDSALTDEAKVRLEDGRRVKVI
jgi:adenine-specific DNA-methyltransferase